MHCIKAMLSRRALVAFVVTGFGVLATAGAASAATYTVNDATDAPLATSTDTNCVSTHNGSCTLRAAVQAADNSGTNSTITVPAGTYKLTIPSATSDDPSTGDLDIDNNANVTINGAGSSSTTIDANNVDRAFAVQYQAGLKLSGMTIENGNPDTKSSGYEDGGAVYSDGALDVTSDVTFQDNQALNGDYGGAISTDSDTGSSLSLTGATFLRNNAYYGGAIYSDQPGASSISQSTFTDNNANDDYGGAIYGDNGGMNVDSSSFTTNNAEEGGAIYWDNNTAVTITNTSFTGNAAGYDYGGAIVDYESSSMTLNSDQFVGNSGGEGGALYLESYDTSPSYTLNNDEFDSNVANSEGGAIDWEEGTLTSSGSSMVNNRGGEYGGGLYADSGSALSLTNATISGNQAGEGGGIYYDTSTPTSLTNDTIAYNSAANTEGGGIYDPNDYATTGSGATGVLNTIVADNRGGDCGNGGGTSQFPASLDSGHNLDSDSSCFGGLGGAGDKPGVDPKLAQAADNGGPVLTDRLESGSPAIDTGTNAGCPSTDARGISRPQGAACDMGAFEAAASALSVSKSAPANGTTGIPFEYTITVTPSGPAASTDTTVTDQLPAGETLYGATPSQGSCSSSGSPAKVTCDLGTVRVGNNATVTLLVAEANAGSVTNTATTTNNEGANVSASATTKLVAPVAPAGATGPKASTDGHSNKTKHSAKVKGHVTNGSQPTFFFFQYGRSRKLGSASNLVRITSSANVSATIRHLLAGKKYFFRLVAVNDSGTSYGAKHHFRTKKNKKHHRHHHH